MPVSRKSRQGGLGLVELLVGIVVSLMVLAATVYVFIGNSESGLWFVRSSRASEQLRDIIVRMERDVRRAGYQGWRYLASSSVVVDPLTSPNVFDHRSDDPEVNTALAMLKCKPEDGTCALVELASVDKKVSEGGCRPDAIPDDVDPMIVCDGITYAYNRDDDGTSAADRPAIGRGAGSNCPAAAPFDTDGTVRSEWFGFRFFLGRVQMRTSTTACGPVPDAADWEDITDDRVIVALGGFRLEDECVGIIDEVGPGGGPPDGDVFEDVDEDGELTCQDLCDAGTLDDGDLVVIAPRVWIVAAGHSRQNERLSEVGSASDTENPNYNDTFRMSQVVDLPNFGARRVPLEGICE